MFTDIIKNCNSFKIIYKGKYYENKDVQDFFEKSLINSYFAPSYVTADNTIITHESKKGIWLEISFNELRTFSNHSFTKLLTPIKPKCNWLTFYRNIDGEYSGKCINLNLSGTTTDLYNIIKEHIDEK